MKIEISKLGVSQLYINERKLKAVREWLSEGEGFSSNPLPVYDFGDGYVLIDGHTRALAAFLQGTKEVCIEPDETDYFDDAETLALYKTCIGWCVEENIKDVAALAERIIPDEEYEEKWIKRCAELSSEE